MTPDAVPSPPPTPADHLGWLADGMDRFAAVLSAADLTTPVPSCPGWTLAGLAGHLGEVHTWVVVAIREGHPNAEVTPPADPAAIPGWYREQADGLLAVLREVGPDGEAWTFGPKPRTARFWFRRQQHETAMHLWDALSALPAGPEPVRYGGDPTTAAARAHDAVDEVVTMFFPRQVRMGRIPALDRSLAVTALETGHRWLLAADGQPGPDPATIDAALKAPSEDLALLLWRRLDLDTALGRGAQLEGDPEAARAVLTAGLTP
jgi:uncharacterized protein (TIGR03083 family)